MAVFSPSSFLTGTVIHATVSPAAGTLYPTPPRLFLPAKVHRHPCRTLYLSTSGASRLLPAISAVHFEDLVEKDWSFLDADPADSDRSRRVDRAIAAAEVGEKSVVLACLPTARFVDRLVETASCKLVLANHDSLMVLAEIKERHDAVRCWQGGVEAVPERFSPLDAVFLCYFPAMGVTVNQLLGSLAGRCSPGARVVISCDVGREAVERVHRRQHPDIVTSDLPDKLSLEKAASDNSFQISEFVDDPSFYLAVLKFCR